MLEIPEIWFYKPTIINFDSEVKINIKLVLEKQWQVSNTSQTEKPSNFPLAKLPVLTVKKTSIT